MCAMPRRFLLLQLVLTLVVANAAEQKPLNLLYIIIDDLRTETGTYVSATRHTPKLDAFAETSVQFQRAYANVALCGPSRASMLTGRNPEDLQYYQHNIRASNQDTEEIDDDIIKKQAGETLPEVLRAAGYRIRGGGKLFHESRTSSSVLGEQNFISTKPLRCDGESVSCVIRQVDAADHALAQYGLKKLDELKDSADPWAIFLGFRKPHLPYAVPEKHVRNIEAIYPNLEDVPLPVNRVRDNPFSLANYYCHAIENYKEVQGTTVIGLPYAPFSETTTRILRKGYYAAVAWADDLVGQVLEKLEENSLASSTVVVITSDHGFALGEHGNWCKNSNYELATRTPLWIRDPLAETAPRRVENIVSLVDIYPTVLDLVGLNQTFRPPHLDGDSLTGLFRPSKGSMEKSDLAFTITGRCYNVAVDGSLSSKRCAVVSDISHLGYSIRTDRWRYTEWRPYFAANNSADWNQTAVDLQLFDHSGDNGTNPDTSETKNLASNASEFHQSVMKVLSEAIFTRLACTLLDPDAPCDMGNLDVPSEATLAPTVVTSAPTDATPTPSGSPVTSAPTMLVTAHPSPLDEADSNSTSPSIPVGGSEEGLSGGGISAIVIVVLLLAAGFTASAVLYVRKLKPKEGDEEKSVAQKTEQPAQNAEQPINNEPESEDAVEKEQQGEPAAPEATKLRQA